ncbi:hypothetical protein DFH28DRAFT_911683 [Melampsora americana]|nr:hypothetical protein DFH28DRAFT_911683 [Melampsora americana]
MGKKGTAVQCPLGVAPKKRRVKNVAEGSAIIVDKVEASEAQYVNDRLIEIDQALMAVQDPIPGNSQAQANLFNAEENNDMLYGDTYNHIDEFLPAQNPAVAPELNVTFENYIQGAFYKSKKMTENKNWKKALPDMFITYMTLSQESSQWGDINKWNYDHNKQCCCGAGNQKTRKVDMLDILERKQVEIIFCKCTLDQVCLVRMGYIGGSAVHPQTAYSIRLLRMHHSFWKYCTVRTQGFALGLDEFLDPANPLILVGKTNQASNSLPRRWRKTLSSAIDAYRYILRKQKELTICALYLTALDQLAMNCPRCFGPLQAKPDTGESDYHVCTDGNFQHRRHLAASQEYEEMEMENPPLFLDNKKVEEWRMRTGGKDPRGVGVCTLSLSSAIKNCTPDPG